VARFLVYTAPAIGHLYPVVPTMVELRERGHEVAVRTVSGGIDDLDGLGLSAAPVDPAIEAIKLEDWRARTPPAAARLTLSCFADRAEHAIEDMKGAIAQERPDALLVDDNAWGAAFAAEASGLPWSIYSVTSPQIPAPGIPPFGPGLAPRDDLLGRLRDAALRRVSHAAVQRSVQARVNPMRSRLGLPGHQGIGDLFLSAPLVIYYTAEPFEYPRPRWPDNVRLVGPGIWDPPADRPAWLDEIDRRMVLVTTSTDFQHDGKLVSTALQALGGEDLFVVATTGALEPSAFEPPPNSRLERFLPHRPLLEKASCVVSHAGTGITQKALAAGVPVCAVPFGRDHFETARRVEVADAGTRLPGGRLNAERLRAAVIEALDKRQGAERIAEAFRSAGGAPAAADSLEGLLA
jgi:MGT family glycosyltransferase